MENHQIEEPERYEEPPSFCPCGCGETWPDPCSGEPLKATSIRMRLEVAIELAEQMRDARWGSTNYFYGLADKLVKHLTAFHPEDVNRDVDGAQS